MGKSRAPMSFEELQRLEWEAHVRKAGAMTAASPKPVGNPSPPRNALYPIPADARHFRLLCVGAFCLGDLHGRVPPELAGGGPCVVAAAIWPLSGENYEAGSRYNVLSVDVWIWTLS